MFPLWKTHEPVSLALEAGHIMHIRAGERLRLTLWGAGGRAMVSLNTYGVTQPALEGLDPAEDGFTYDVTSWLHDGVNTLTVVLIGQPGDVPFRMVISHADHPEHVLDEADFLPLATPWRLWTLRIERVPARSHATVGLALSHPERALRIQSEPGPLGRGMDLRTDQIMAPVSLVRIDTPDHPSSAASARNVP